MPKLCLNAVAKAHAAEKLCSRRLARAIAKLYVFRSLRRVCLRICKKLEGGELWSQTARELLSTYHGVTVGKYTYGVLRPQVLPRGTVIGRYCSVAERLSIYRRNHPLQRLSQHPFFYNSVLGYVEGDSIMAVFDNPLTVGHDVWLGAGVTILPGCKSIGNGAIVAAGSVVTRDVPEFTVVAGNPARAVRARYDKPVERAIADSKWWEYDLSELLYADDLLLEELMRESLVSRAVDKIQRGSCLYD